MGEERAKKLRYIFQANIVTQSTKDIMERVAGIQRGKLNVPWPGRTFDMSTEEGQALLATSPGVGVAYMIKDHNDVLGRKIPFAGIFTIERPRESGSRSRPVEADYHILWELRDTISG